MVFILIKKLPELTSQSLVLLCQVRCQLTCLNIFYSDGIRCTGMGSDGLGWIEMHSNGFIWIEIGSDGVLEILH